MFMAYKSMISKCIPTFDINDTNSLVLEFQECTHNKRKNEIYATLFCNHFPMMVKISNKYHNFSNEEKVENCMCVLLYALNTYKKDCKTKFTTYFYQGLDNSYKTLISRSQTNKRKVWGLIDRQEGCFDRALDKLSKRPIPKNDLDAIKRIQENDQLDAIEKDYCTCVLSGFTRSRDIADLLHLAKRVNNMEVTNPLYEKTNINLVNKVRSGLKNRFINNKYELIN